MNIPKTCLTFHKVCLLSTFQNVRQCFSTPRVTLDNYGLDSKLIVERGKATEVHGAVEMLLNGCGPCPRGAGRVGSVCGRPSTAASPGRWCEGTSCLSSSSDRRTSSRLVLGRSTFYLPQSEEMRVSEIGLGEKKKKRKEVHPTKPKGKTWRF